MTYERIHGKHFKVHIHSFPHFNLIVDNPERVREEIYQFLYAITRNHRHALHNLDIGFVVANKDYYGTETEELYVEWIAKNNEHITTPSAIEIVCETIHVPFVPEYSTQSALNPKLPAEPLDKPTTL